MKSIKIKGLNKRGKERIKTHGSEMTLLKETKEGYILVQSLNKTWNDTFWLGWFKLGKEVNYEKN
jgi:hypothetical protein